MNIIERSFSVIMTVYDQAPELEKNLPVFLTQEYEQGYEVIIVDETSTDNTSNVLKLLKNQYPHLYTTFLPKPNRLIIRKKIAISIGIKAAKNDWVIITQINKTPLASDMLKTIAGVMDDHTELMLGYMDNKKILLQLFSDTQEAQCHIRKAERKVKKVPKWKRMGYTWGRYDFIIVRKDKAHDILKYYEEKISLFALFGIRLRIFWKNLIGRSTITKLVVQ